MGRTLSERRGESGTGAYRAVKTLLWAPLTCGVPR